jgi:hypothetical protein
MCFSLSDLDGDEANFCIYVDREGKTIERDNGMWYALGSYNLGSKALPACFEMDTEQVMGSIDAAGDATRVQVQPSPTASTSTVSTSSNSSSSQSTNIQTTSLPQGNPSTNGHPETTNVSRLAIRTWAYKYLPPLSRRVL